MSAIDVKLNVFEGPLDLLLHLIEKNKVNIYDIPIVTITEQYLDYVNHMEEEDLDIMSEFLVIAAKVTSKDLRADGSGKCLPILDWQECGLRKPSFVRIDQVFELSYDKLLREAPIGRVNRAYVQVITSYLEF